MEISVTTLSCGKNQKIFKYERSATKQNGIPKNKLKENVNQKTARTVKVYRKINKIFSRKQIKKKILHTKFNFLSSRNISTISRRSDRFEGTFRKAIWPFLVISQLFGVMPVVGVSNLSLSNLRFEWKSLRTFYALLITTSITSYSLFLIWKMLTGTVHLPIIANILFYGLNSLGFISFLVLSPYWPELMQRWENIESLPIFRNSTYKAKYMRRIRLTALIVLLLALAEHLLSITSAIHLILENLEKYTTAGFISELVSILVPQRHSLPMWIATLMCIINENTTFMWNYVDIFIMMIGIGLSTHFHLLNMELEQAGIDNLSQNNWMEMRAQYAKLCDLVAIVDKKISHLILISFLNNLFVICNQLYQSLSPAPTYFHLVYFWFSLTFLIMRMFAVSLLAAAVHDESQKPIEILRTVPSHLWNVETKRFFNDILCKYVALSGMQFFFLTRKLILSVTGTVITYELVLMQFNRSN